MYADRVDLLTTSSTAVRQGVTAGEPTTEERDESMKKSKFGIVGKTLIAFSAALVILTISLTTATMAPLSEGFEAGGKTSYAAANVTLGTGSWFMDDALTGNLSTDRKTGSWSARIRNTGLVRMNFNKTGAATVSIQHAVFGTDGSSTWQLWLPLARMPR